MIITQSTMSTFLDRRRPVLLDWTCSEERAGVGVFELNERIVVDRRDHEAPRPQWLRRPRVRSVAARNT
ncbi:hypothetical protein FI667_g15777, partial [Globisporangium splendens]